MAEVLKDSLHRSRYLLNYVDSLRLRRNVQRALNRGESSINWYVP
jgi:TnpA family transposase